MVHVAISRFLFMMSNVFDNLPIEGNCLLFFIVLIFLNATDYYFESL